MRVLAVLALVALCATAAYGSPGDFAGQINFAASAPYTYNHATGGGAFNDRTVGNWDDITEQLEGGQFACGDLVTFLTRVTMEANTDDQQQGMHLEYAFTADTTGQSGVAFTNIQSFSINYDNVENGDGGADTNPGVGFFGPDSANTVRPGLSAALENQAFDGEPFTQQAWLNANFTISHNPGLKAGEQLVFRIDVLLECKPNTRPTGNLQGKFMYGNMIDSNGNVGPRLNVGTQTIPLKNAGSVRSAGEPGIDVTKSVSFNSDCSDAHQSITVLQPDTTVYYCYSVHNPGTATLYNLNLLDDNGTPNDALDDFTVTLVDAGNDDGFKLTGKQDGNNCPCLEAGATVYGSKALLLSSPREIFNVVNATGTGPEMQVQDDPNCKDSDPGNCKTHPVSYTYQDQDDALIVDGTTVIRGHICGDSNKNGVQDANEPNLPNVNVIIYEASTPGNLITVKTDVNGDWSLQVAPGSYTVNVDESTLPPSHNGQQTIGKDPETISVDASQATWDFGSDCYHTPLLARGHVFVDAVEYGVEDSADQPLSDVPITVVCTPTAGGNSQTYTTTTNGNGDWSVVIDETSSCVATVQTNSAPLQQYPIQSFGENPTTCNVVHQVGGTDCGHDGFHSSTSDDGTGKNKLSGYVFVDNNDNHVLDSGNDIPIEGVLIQAIDCFSPTTVFEAHTDENGFYFFDALPGACYNIAEQPLPGLVSSYDPLWWGPGTCDTIPSTNAQLTSGYAEEIIDPRTIEQVFNSLSNGQYDCTQYNFTYKKTPCAEAPCTGTPTACTSTGTGRLGSVSDANAKSVKLCFSGTTCSSA